jgi:hypothetical protein
VSSAEDLFEKLREIRYEATAIQGKLSDVFGILDSLEIVDAPRPRCDRCGASFRGRRSLAEHAYTAHGGEVPEHWLEAEGRSAA